MAICRMIGIVALNEVVIVGWPENLSFSLIDQGECKRWNKTMYRVMLVVEDMNEMNQLTGLFKKLGCDVDTLLTEVGLQTRVLGFNPDVIFVSGKEKKISPVVIAKKILEIGCKSKVVLEIPQGTQIQPQDLTRAKVDGIVQGPANSQAIILAVAKVLGQDGAQWIDRLQKLGMMAIQASGPIPSSTENKRRTDKYAKFISGITVSPTSTVQKTEAKKRWKELEKDWSQDELSSQDAEKRQFVKALFKK